MSHADTLYALAQIAVAFAGFAGLMAFVRERAAGPLTQVQRNRLIGMVRVALIATAFAILPIVVSAQGLLESTAWRASGALFAVAFAPITVIAGGDCERSARGASSYGPVYSAGCDAWLALIVGSVVSRNTRRACTSRACSSCFLSRARSFSPW